MLAAIAVPSKSLRTEEVFIMVSPFTVFPENSTNCGCGKRHRDHRNSVVRRFGKAAGAFRLGLAGVCSIRNWTIRGV